MNKKNLLLLADKLERYRPTTKTKWGMSWWADTSECGTVACAFGTAGIRGWIPGFTAKYDKERDEWSWYLNGEKGQPHHIGRKLFRISLHQFTYLFAPPEYDAYHEHITPQMVATRIRELVKRSR